MRFGRDRNDDGAVVICVPVLASAMVCGVLEVVGDDGIDEQDAVSAGMRDDIGLTGDAHDEQIVAQSDDIRGVGRRVGLQPDGIGRAYLPFTVYAKYEHGDSYAAAARALCSRSSATPLTTRVTASTEAATATG